MSKFYFQIENTLRHGGKSSSEYIAKISSGSGHLDFQFYYYTHLHGEVGHKHYYLQGKQQTFYSYKDLEKVMKEDWLSKHGPKNDKKKPEPTQQNKSNSTAQAILWLLFAILIWPTMLMLILLAGVTDIILFLLTMGLCFGKCKDTKRTWFSYSCVRGATKWASEMVKEICNYLGSCNCCFCCLFTLPIGFVFIIIGFAFDFIAWILTGFYWWGYCCSNLSILEFSLGRLAWKNWRSCLLKVRNCG